MTLSFFILILAIGWIILGTTRYKMHPFLVLLSASIFLAIGTGIELKEIPVLLGKGLGKQRKVLVYSFYLAL